MLAAKLQESKHPIFENLTYLTLLDRAILRVSPKSKVITSLLCDLVSCTWHHLHDRGIRVERERERERTQKECKSVLYVCMYIYIYCNISIICICIYVYIYNIYIYNYIYIYHAINTHERYHQ